MIPEDFEVENNQENEEFDQEFDQDFEDENNQEKVQNSGKFEKIVQDGEKKYKLSGMYREWFIDYASYVILERAVPHITDGLKPVQRRILYSMKLQDDGRLNKVATLVGATMPFHPHGDASIKDALVQLGQKEILIDCQGNWGNILTGDSAAAGRYIEARLTTFAKEVVFNAKTTEWVSSYDGRNREPVSLPVKFPLLLAQGAEGIAVALSCKILPHNFNELIDASIAYLRGEEFELLPDFITEGLADVSAYNRGLRGGKVRVRSNIVKQSKNTLVINEIPYGETTTSLIESILKANEKGKIKIKKIDDNTAEKAEIVITLNNDISPDRTIDALYAFTKCEVSISPNSCVIMDNKPCFIGVDEILKHNTDSTRSLLKQELEIRLAELSSEWHYTSLEKIFFENKIYQILEGQARTWEQQLDEVFVKMKEYEPVLKMPVEMDDILKLVEKPVRKISRFDIKSVNLKIASIEEKQAEVEANLNRLTEYTIDWYASLKEKYGHKYPRRTKLISFEDILATKVAANNVKLYVNREEGFVGTNQKKIENAEYICDCSDIDDVIVVLKNGKYMISKISDKFFFDKNILHVAIFNKADQRTIYNVIYRSGKGGLYYAKRFAIVGITRDKWYDLTKGEEGSTIVWFTSNPNGEAELLRIYLRPRPKLKKLNFDFDFATLAIKNRSAQGNIASRFPIQRISLKSSGVSTIGAKKLWFDRDINRLNDEGRGDLLGDFIGNEHILALFKEGSFYTTNLDFSNRYQGDLLLIQQFNPKTVCSVVYWVEETKSFYLKRFNFELSDNNMQSIISESKGSYLHSFSMDALPQLKIHFVATEKKSREPEIVNVSEFISVKGFKAKGKRLSTHEIESIEFIEPILDLTPDTEMELVGIDAGEGMNHIIEEDSSTEFMAGTVIDLIDENEPTLF